MLILPSLLEKRSIAQPSMSPVAAMAAVADPSGSMRILRRGG
jgi:hypothetical protein